MLSHGLQERNFLTCTTLQVPRPSSRQNIIVSIRNGKAIDSTDVGFTSLEWSFWFGFIHVRTFSGVMKGVGGQLIFGDTKNQKQK